MKTNLKSSTSVSADSKSMQIPWSYLDKQFSPEKIEEIFDLFRAFVPTGDFTLGKPLQEFEQKFARLIGTKHALGVGSGTDALKLSLKALGIGYGDEVITTANTFVATVGSIVETGATPVFVDCTDNFCMDTSQLESKITSRTKAIMPVHYAGQMTDMPALMPIALKYKLKVVEDSCQCILGNIKGKNAGTFGNAGGFSLHPLKNLNVWGDGGMIVTNDDALADILSKLRNHGLAGRDEVVIMGCNSRLDTLQAVIGNWLIGDVHTITDTRIRNANMLDASLSALPQITIPARFSNRKLVFHLYIVFAERRDELLSYCKSRGIPAKIHYPVPIYRQPALASLCGHKEGDFPVTDRHAKTMISFPAHDHLSEEQLQYIIDTVREFYEK